MAAAQPFRILYVCTGNIARSPVAAACALEILGGDTSGDVLWDVVSAGTHAVGGEGLKPEAERVATELGFDLSGHGAVALTTEACETADLILTMSWDQVAHIWSLVPEAWGKCFTIKEFVHWAKQSPSRPPILFPNKVEAMRDKVAQTHSIRKRARADFGFWGGLRPQDLNLVEPDGRGDTAWRNLGQAIQLLVTDALRLLEGPGVVSEAR